jgi:hypothetical protein
VREIIPGRIVIKIPKKVLQAVGALQILRFHLTKKQPALTPSAIERYYLNAAFSCQKAVEELNYKVTPFAKGIAETIHQLKQKAK